MAAATAEKIRISSRKKRGYAEIVACDISVLSLIVARNHNCMWQHNWEGGSSLEDLRQRNRINRREKSNIFKSNNVHQILQ